MLVHPKFGSDASAIFRFRFAFPSAAVLFAMIAVTPGGPLRIPFRLRFKDEDSQKEKNKDAHSDVRYEFLHLCERIREVFHRGRRGRTFWCNGGEQREAAQLIRDGLRVEEGKLCCEDWPGVGDAVTAIMD